MIRWALGGVLGLAALLVVWLRLVGAGVPEVLAPAGGTMRTVDLGTLAAELELPGPLASQDSGAASEQPPAEVHAEEVESSEERLDPARAASLIRRMLTVYRRTSGLQ
ncbi:MAG: hypothetical protein ABFS46_14290 [Myxococcota bacterium]